MRLTGIFTTLSPASPGSRRGRKARDQLAISGLVAQRRQVGVVLDPGRVLEAGLDRALQGLERRPARAGLRARAREVVPDIGLVRVDLGRHGEDQRGAAGIL